VAMTSARAVYAQRYARVGLVHPRRPMTDAEWQAYVSGLSELGQVLAQFSRSMSEGLARWQVNGPPATSPRPPRSVAVIMRPH
jgi:hypothetical protein